MSNGSSIERKTVRIATSDGNFMQAYMALPPGGARPGLVIAQEIFGVNASMRAVADEFAVEGLVTLVPDLFWRIKPGIELGYTDADKQQAFGLLAKFDAKRGAQDINDAASWLATQQAAVSSVAMMGFCLGGKVVILAAAANASLAAVISFYGVRVDENLNEMRTIACPFQFHVGDSDTHVPLETVKKIEQSLTDMPKAQLFVYPGTRHAFFNKDRGDAYDAAASRLAKARVLSTLRGE